MRCTRSQIPLFEINTINFLELRAQTVGEYLDAINDLFCSRGFNEPVDFDNKTSAPVIFYEDVKTWENEPERRTHITPEFLAELRSRAQLDKSGLGLPAPCWIGHCSDATQVVVWPSTASRLRRKSITISCPVERKS